MKLPLATAAIISIAATATELSENPKECITASDYDADTDFFPEKFVPHETTDLLEVTYHKTYKIITNKFQNKTYLLYQCGTQPPTDEIESGDYHLVLPVPHQGKLGVTETPQITPLEQLGLRPEIAVYIGNPKLVSSPCLNYMAQEDELDIIYYEEDPWNATLSAQGIAAYLVEQPELVIFAGPYGDADAERHMAVPATQERTNSATFDWLGMYATLYNLEGMANAIIDETEERYQCTADNAAAITADLAEEDKPTILWAQYFSGIGWSVAECPTWDDAYYCEYAHHCGANIISRPEGVGFNQSYDGGKTLYWYLTDEEFLELGKDVPTWIYPSQTFNEVYSEKKEMLDQFKSVQMLDVYDTQGQGAFSWHEQRMGEYDVVALDFCTLVGTNNPDTVHRRRWFRNYYIDPIGSPGSCNAPDEVGEPYVPQEAACDPIGSKAVSTESSDVEEPQEEGEEQMENGSASNEDSDAGSADSVSSSANVMGSSVVLLVASILAM